MDDSQEFLTLAEATRVVPGRPTIGTLWRWITRGIRGGEVRLDSMCVGGRRFVTRQAINEFLAHCGQAAEASARACEHPRRRECTSGKRTPKQLEADLARAERILGR